MENYPQYQIEPPASYAAVQSSRIAESGGDASGHTAVLTRLDDRMTSYGSRHDTMSFVI